MVSAALGLVVLLAVLALVAGVIRFGDAVLAYRSQRARQAFREQVLLAQAHAEAFRHE